MIRDYTLAVVDKSFQYTYRVTNLSLVVLDVRRSNKMRPNLTCTDDPVITKIRTHREIHLSVVLVNPPIVHLSVVWLPFMTTTLNGTIWWTTLKGGHITLECTVSMTTVKCTVLSLNKQFHIYYAYCCTNHYQMTTQ
jgi:hypothetical protein